MLYCNTIRAVKLKLIQLFEVNMVWQDLIINCSWYIISHFSLETDILVNLVSPPMTPGNLGFKRSMPTKYDQLHAKYSNDVHYIDYSTGNLI